MIHELKILPHFFQAIVDGKKTFELRRNDRPYKEGDRLILNEWNGWKYTNRKIEVAVTYTFSDSTYLQEDYIALGIKLL